MILIPYSLLFCKGSSIGVIIYYNDVITQWVLVYFNDIHHTMGVVHFNDIHHTMGAGLL